MNLHKNQIRLKDLDAIISLLPGYFYWKDVHGNYLGCSNNISEIFNLKPDQLIGKTDQQLWPEQAGVLREFDEQVITHRKALTIEETLSLKSGKTITLLVSRLPWIDEHDKVVGIIANLVDITAQKQKELQLKNDVMEAEFSLKKAKEELQEFNSGNIINEKSNDPRTKLSNSIISEPVKEETLSFTYPLSQVLIVEDHPITANITKKILADLGCQVKIAPTGEAASSEISNNTYDLILMDIGLPDIDGCEVTRRVRLIETKSGSNHLPIIGLTARVDVKDKQRSIDAGMNAVFSKPLTKEKVQQIFMTFIPKFAVENLILPLESQSLDHDKIAQESDLIIDLKLGAKLIGADEKLAKEIIWMLIQSFPDELLKFEEASQVSDWQTAKTIAHKLRGGTSYSGAPRLRQACIKLDECLKSGQKEDIASLFELVKVELDAVKHYAELWKSER